MSQITIKTTRCGCCGCERRELELISTNVYESSDLDSRPGRMYRDTMGTWLQECTNCNYISVSLEDGKPEYHDFWLQDHNIDDTILQNVLATRFYKYALWNLNMKRSESAYRNFLHAAWVMDDNSNREGARICRKKAISLFPMLVEEKLLEEEIILIQADMLRRVSEFQKVKELLYDFHFQNELYQIIAEYQLMLSDNKDTGCYKEEQAYAYSKKLKQDWKENGILEGKEKRYKKEILEKYYPDITNDEKYCFERGWELIKKLERFMQCFYEQYRTTDNLLKYLEIINRTRDYEFFSVQNMYFKEWLEDTFSMYEKREVIMYSLKIVEYMKLSQEVSEDISSADENTKKLIDLINEILKDDNPKLTNEEKNIREVLREYDRALTLLDQYDHQNMIRPTGHKAKTAIDYKECKKAINYMKERSFPASELFGKEKDDSFKGALSNIEQIYNGEEVYSSIEEKAAHLLYFVTKNHSFYDGNKRIAAAMFLYYLNKNDRLFLWDGKKIIEDSTLATLIVMLAESRPEDKEIMIDMVINCLYL